MNISQNAGLYDDLKTVADFIRFTASQFNQADIYFGHGTDNAWDEATVLVMFALHLPTENAELAQHCRLTKDEKKYVLELVQRRITEEVPLAYITQQTYFAGLPFYVDDRVLVPRSPIAEYLEQRFAPFIPQGQNVNRILDLCTGSGCIAIACAAYFPEADIDAVDLSIDALNVAQINIENHGLTEQVIPIQSDVFSGVASEVYDLIVTNPPYVDVDDIASMPAEFHHEPEMGLGCGHDGLDIVRTMLAEAASHLSEKGILVCEVGNSQIHVEEVYPEVPFTWLTFERGGHGVFILTREQLVSYSHIFKERAKL